MKRLKTDLTTEKNSQLVDHDKVGRIEAEIADMEDKRRSFLTMRIPPAHSSRWRNLKGTLS